MFINYLLATSERLPEIGPYLYEYVVAGNGVFVRAKRPGLEAMIPVSWATIKGLKDVFPYVRIQSRVPASLLRASLRWAVDALPNEVMFWMGLHLNQWQLVRPQQYATEFSVRPDNPHSDFGAKALIDLHSHNRMPPFFSRTDDKDEIGFRIYAVIGNINVKSQTPPSILVRVGIYGHFSYIPARTVFDLPDCLQEQCLLAEKEEQK